MWSNDIKCVHSDYTMRLAHCWVFWHVLKPELIRIGFLQSWQMGSETSRPRGQSGRGWNFKTHGPWGTFKTRLVNTFLKSLYNWTIFIVPYSKYTYNLTRVLVAGHLFVTIILQNLYWIRPDSWIDLQFPARWFFCWTKEWLDTSRSWRKKCLQKSI